VCEQARRNESAGFVVVYNNNNVKKTFLRRYVVYWDPSWCLRLPTAAAAEALDDVAKGSIVVVVRNKQSKLQKIDPINIVGTVIDIFGTVINMVVVLLLFCAVWLWWVAGCFPREYGRRLDCFSGKKGAA
jgi:hypothetical protein